MSQSSLKYRILRRYARKHGLPFAEAQQQWEAMIGDCVATRDSFAKYCVKRGVK